MFLRKGVGGAVGGVVTAFVVMKVYSIGKAKLLVSRSKICFAAYIALYSVIGVAVPCGTGRKAHGQAGKGKLGIVFCSRMRKEPVAVINCGGCIRLRQTVAVQHLVAAAGARLAYRSGSGQAEQPEQRNAK